MSSSMPANLDACASVGTRSARILPLLGATFCRCVIALAVLTAACTLTGCGGWRIIAEVHYRVQIVVDVEGVETSASAVQGLRYLWGGDGNWKPMIVSESKGRAPVIDLGENGWLVAAISTEFSNWPERLSGFSNWMYRDEYPAQSCGYADDFSSMFERAMGIASNGARTEYPTKQDQIRANSEDYETKRDERKLQNKLARMPAGPQAVVAPRLPAFIWFPRNASFTAGIQLCPEEFRRVIGAAIGLRSVTVDVVSSSTHIDERVPDPAPPWLAELRRANAKENRGRIANEAYYRYRQVEDSWW